MVLTAPLATVLVQVSHMIISDQTANFTIRDNVVLLPTILLQGHKDPIMIFFATDGLTQLRGAFFLAGAILTASKRRDASPSMLQSHMPIAG